MKLCDLAEEYAATRSPGWLVLGPDEISQCLIEATRYFAAYGNIASLSQAVQPQSAPGAGKPLPLPPDLVPDFEDALPVRDLKLIKENTDITVGEWAIIRPLFWLYAERENTLRLEASRASGLEPYGRQTSEITQDIAVMENETLPGKAFHFIAIEV